MTMMDVIACNAGMDLAKKIKLIIASVAYSNDCETYVRNQMEEALAEYTKEVPEYLWD